MTGSVSTPPPGIIFCTAPPFFHGSRRPAHHVFADVFIKKKGRTTRIHPSVARPSSVFYKTRRFLPPSCEEFGFIGISVFSGCSFSLSPLSYTYFYYHLNLSIVN
jgi:hypothetical protein